MSIKFYTDILSQEQEYRVKGVRYIVESLFCPFPDPEQKTMRDRVERLLTGDLVNLELLAKKSEKDARMERKLLQDELQSSIARNEAVAQLFEKLYEDNATGKVTDDWFMQLSHKYELERAALKEKINDLQIKLHDMDHHKKGYDRLAI